MLKAFNLKNGIHVATYDLPNVRSLHLRVSVKCGSIVEENNNNGIAHLMEHLLVQGIPTLPTASEFSNYVESLAGTYSAYTENLLIGFNITLPVTHVEDSIKLSSEVIFEPIFTQDAINKERGVVITEIKQKMDSHFFTITDFFLENRFKKDHPLARYTGGSIDVVEKLNREEILYFWKRFFIPQNTFIQVTGKFNETELIFLLEKYFGRYKQTKQIPGYPSMGREDFSSQRVALRFDPKLKAVYLDLTFPGISLENSLKMRQLQNLALIILGNLRNSRLFKLLRYQRGLVYDISAGGSMKPGLGFVYVTSEVSVEYLDEVISLIVKELLNYIHSGPTKEELGFVKNYLSNRWLMIFDHPSSIAGWIESDLLWNDKVRLPEEYIELISDITVQDIIDLMQKEWDFSKLNLTLQGPIKDTKANLEKYQEVIKELR